jgi:hypothetical protein
VTDDADELDRRLARLFEEGHRGEDPTDHPSPEKLSAYQANELPPEEADEIQEHLTECSLCTELLLDLQRFLEPEEEDRSQEGVADFGAEAGWRELRGKMEWKRESESHDTPGAEMSRLRKSLRRLQAVAAIILVGLVGLSVYALRLRQEVRASETLVSVSLINAIGARGEEDAETLKASSGDSIVFTLFNPRGPSREYRVEIRDAKGRTVWGRSGLPMREDYLAFPVPPKTLGPGSYEVRIFAENHIAGRYFVKIVPAQ